MSDPSYTDLVSNLRREVQSGKTLPQAYRESQLRGLLKFCKDNEEAVVEACQKDLGKPRSETILAEYGMVFGDVALALEKLGEWMKPEFPSVPLINAADRAQVRSEPLGVVLIIGAWNYPIQLTLVPLVGALAAGCAVVLKPSEVSVHTAKLLEKLTNYLDKSTFAVVNGAVKETTALLREKWDHIFYTGNGVVGRVIMEAAAKHLTPVTLELGGKSPCIVDADSDLTIAARRITWGRFVNCGQTCIAPDYVICTSQAIVQPLVAAIRVALEEYYGADPKQSKDYGRIVNDNHIGRLRRLLESSQTKTVEIGGQIDSSERYFAPTVITGVQETDAIMKDEIFGPILPIIAVQSVDQAISFINAHDKPLSLYVFSRNGRTVEKVFSQTSSGSALANDCLMQATIHTLPFGGVGASGMGSYHGKRSFDVFSHRKAVMIKDQNLEAVNALRYPPYNDNKTSWLVWLLFPTVPESSGSRTQWLKKLAIIVGIVAVYLKFIAK